MQDTGKIDFVPSCPRVCMFSESYYPQTGGTPTQALALAEGLTRAGFPPLVITRRFEEDVAKSDIYDGVRVFRVGPVGDGAGKKWGMLFTSLPLLVRLRREYDILFVPGFRVIGLVAIFVAWLFGKKCVFRAVSCGEMSGAFFRAGLMKSIAPVRLFFNLFNKFRMFVLRRADAFVTISSVISDEYAGAGITGERVSYIPNGIDPALFSPVGKGEKSELRSKLGVDDVAFIAIYTGRLVRYKGVMTLIDAWEEVVRKHPESRLLLVGAGGNDMHNCEDELRVRAGHLSDSVIFVGDVNNVRDYLCASDVFLFPTENEAFGISLIEAMGCGLPVISTVVGGIKDFLFDRRNGLVFEQGDSEMLAKLIMEVYEDAVLRERLASAAVDTVLEKFSQSLITDRYIGLFRSLEEL